MKSKYKINDIVKYGKNKCDIIIGKVLSGRDYKYYLLSGETVLEFYIDKRLGIAKFFKKSLTS
jgi:hypothetical protein